MSRSSPPTNTDGTPSAGGRRTRLTEDVIEEIAAAVRIGAPVVDACVAVARVKADSAREWLQLGRGEHPRRPDPPQRYIDLARATEEAEAQFVNDVAQGLAKPGENWKARLSLLGALRPQYREKEPAVMISNPILDVVELLRPLHNLRGDAAAAALEALPSPAEPESKTVEGEARVVDEPPEDAEDGQG